MAWHRYRGEKQTKLPFYVSLKIGLMGISWRRRSGVFMVGKIVILLKDLYKYIKERDQEKYDGVKLWGIRPRGVSPGMGCRW